MTWTMLIDTTKCVTCYNCQIACKDEFTQNDWPPYSAATPETGQFWMKLTEHERGTGSRVKLAAVARPCMQCSDAPCMAAAQNGAIYRRSDGIIIIDPVKAVGQQQIVAACPYGAIYWNSSTSLPQKCTFCAHLLDAGWQQPRCVEVCQGFAITFGDISSLQATITAQGYVPMNPEFGTQPNVFYKGLPTSPFISGSVFANAGGDVIVGATVTATDLVSGQITSTTTDPLGEFWINGLGANRSYQVTITAPNTLSRTMVVYTDEAKDVGDIEMF